MTPSDAKTDLDVFYLAFGTAFVVCVCGIFIPGAVEAALAGCGICCGALCLARVWDWLIPRPEVPV